MSIGKTYHSEIPIYTQIPNPYISTSFCIIIALVGKSSRYD